MRLLHQGSGTSTATGSTVVDSYDLAGQLASVDMLFVIFECESNTQATSTVNVLNVTDTVTLFPGLTIAADTDMMYAGYIAQAQSSTTRVDAMVNRLNNGAGSLTGNNRLAVTTPWTGTWTIGLKHFGVTAGGTFTYQWSVYRLVGA